MSSLLPSSWYNHIGRINFKIVSKYIPQHKWINLATIFIGSSVSEKLWEKSRFNMKRLHCKFTLNLYWYKKNWARTTSVQRLTAILSSEGQQTFNNREKENPRSYLKKETGPSSRQHWHQHLVSGKFHKWHLRHS